MNEILGLGVQPKDLGILQVALRGIIVFVVALVTVRLADRRFMAKMSAFDVILGFVLASMLARAINGSAPFVPTLICGLVLVVLHRIIAKLAFYSDWFGGLVKGNAHVLVENGRRNLKAMRSQNITEKDLLEELRYNGNTSTVDAVQTATLERNGQVSVVHAPKAGS